MASVPPIPPLVCSTPPPIDFGEDEDDSGLPPTLTMDEDEDDDEFGDFTMTADGINSERKISDVPPIPQIPRQSEFSNFLADSIPPPLDEPLDEIKDRADKSKTNLVEAFNLNVTSQPSDRDVDISNFPAEDEPFTTSSEDVSKSANDGISVTNHNSDNSSLPSLKLDCLSISSEKELTAPSTPPMLSLSSGDANNIDDEFHDFEEFTEDTQAKAKESTAPSPIMLSVSGTMNESAVGGGLVTLEDLEEDSSDDECHSPKKWNHLKAEENSDEFFAILSVKSDKEIENRTEKITAELEETKDKIPAMTEESCDAGDDDFDDFTCFRSISPPPQPLPTEVEPRPELQPDVAQKLSVPEVENCTFDADFSQFPETAKAAIEVFDDCRKEPQCDESNEESKNDDTTAGGDFDEFQDFSTAPLSDEAKDEKSDDDFGDFVEATATQALSAAPERKSSISEIPSGRQKRLSVMLDMMFPFGDRVVVDDATMEPSDGDENVTRLGEVPGRMDLKPIESAKALEYQWLNSDMRHALIRSLGIDSRNILFGDNWNPSMPRFAANLSFDPLKPLKPQTVESTISQTSSRSAGDGVSSVAGRAGKADSVPVAEFDWNSSGLVNPLDGPKDDADTREAETLHPSQSGESHASDETEQQQQQPEPEPGPESKRRPRSPSRSQTQAEDQRQRIPETTAVAAAVQDIATGGSNDGTPAAPAPAGGAATGAVPADVPADSIGLGFVGAFDQFDIGGGVGGVGGIDAPSLAVDDVEEDAEDIDEVVTTSTYAGPLKETHIYTPSKGSGGCEPAKTMRPGMPSVTVGVATASRPPPPVDPIDFDYEQAAAGIIIDETVVKKEYRDIVYNPPPLPLDVRQDGDGAVTPNANEISDFFVSAVSDAASVEMETDRQQSSPPEQKIEDDDEFCDFQSVPPPIATTVLPPSQARGSPLTTGSMKSRETESGSRLTASALGGGGGSEMILSPAILLPQSIALNTDKPKIEWGESAASINPEELARIEELFPHPKTVKAKDSATSSQRSTPTHQATQNSLSISATVAQMEQQRAANDDDDWSDFVSVPVPPVQTKANASGQAVASSPKNSHHILSLQTEPRRSPMISPQHGPQVSSPRRYRKETEIHTVLTKNSAHTVHNSNDDEWSDFVSSSPAPPSLAKAAARGHLTGQQPQFNSASWQNMNFYNNPLSLYHQGGHRTMQMQWSSTSTSTSSSSSSSLAAAAKTQTVITRKYHNNNNYNSNNNNNYNNNSNGNSNAAHQYLPNQQHQQQQQQQIHIMQDFSTAAPYPSRPLTGGNMAHNQFQVGSAKVAPSVSLIPDLGFVAPAVPSHTTFINALPRPSFTTKK